MARFKDYYYEQKGSPYASAAEYGEVSATIIPGFRFTASRLLSLTLTQPQI